MIVVTGFGRALGGDGAAIDPTPFLKTRKSRKYMGVQDDLAVVAAGRAIASAGLDGAALGERAGLYLAVGYIPFLESDIRPVLDASMHDGQFSMARFSDGGFQKAHPLLTFRCLPNMPAYHVSVNFGLEGPYFVTYPGAGALYVALEEAVAALREGRVDAALVGGVAHQKNFLVEHHFGRIEPPVAADALRDAGAFIVLEAESRARARSSPVRARLAELRVGYEPFDPIEGQPIQEEIVAVDGARGDVAIELGPASLLAALGRAFDDGGAARLAHSLRGRDGTVGESAWVSARGGDG